MRKNFSIHGFAEVIVAGKAIDVHNLYGVGTISTDRAGDTLTVRFQRDNKWPGPEGLPDEVTLTCSGNLKITFNNLVTHPGDLRADAVEVAYYDEDCEWDFFLDESLAESQGFDGLHLSFSSGLVLRIRSNVAQMVVG
ncbi:MAG: hypothetical protein H0V46_01715 [Sphingomonas sp.]|nr:hypothetical protein [Sphingomonas sp.]